MSALRRYIFFAEIKSGSLLVRRGIIDLVFNFNEVIYASSFKIKTWLYLPPY